MNTPSRRMSSSAASMALASSWWTALGGILQDIGDKAGFGRVDCCVLDAVIVGQANKVDVGDGAGLEDTSQAAHGDWRIAKGGGKGRVHFYTRILALFDDVVTFGVVKLIDQFAATGALHAVDWPQSDLLGFICIVRVADNNDGLEGLVIGWRVIGGKANVVGRVEVLCCEAEVERQIEERVYGRRNVASALDSQGAILESTCQRWSPDVASAGLTGGQKSFWKSTTTRAGLNGGGMLEGWYLASRMAPGFQLKYASTYCNG